MNLLIGGDLVPTKSNIELFCKGDATTLLGDELLSLWSTADVRIFNLETPLTDRKSPIAKCGPNLIAPTATVRGIKALNPTLITLANNHILDQGDLGLESTEKILTENGIPFVGSGDTLEEASKPYIIESNNIKIGIYACAEHEFSIATHTSAGANPFDPLESLDHIQNLKAKCNYVIVLYHGGKEHYRYPSPYLQKQCRKMAEKGADLIICQHSHCVGCFEEYKDSTIIYGQGNFLFDRSESEFWQTSILIQVRLEENGLPRIKYIPIEKADNTVRIADKHSHFYILEDFYSRSNEIKNHNLLIEKYTEFAKERLTYYKYTFSFFGWILQKIDKIIFKSFIINKIYNKKKLLAIRNYIECEAHRELLLYGIYRYE